MQESIVETLKNMKSEQNLTLQQISSASGVPLSTVNRILSGQTENPSFRDVAAIVAAMDGSLDAITGLQKSESENGQLLDSNVMQLLLSMQNYYAKTLDATRQQYMRELENKDKQYRVASNIKPFQAADRIGQVLGSVVFQLSFLIGYGVALAIHIIVSAQTLVKSSDFLAFAHGFVSFLRYVKLCVLRDFQII